jgi:hypothetical protein
VARSKSNHPHNLDWERLCLKPVTERDLKKMLASTVVRFAAATDTQLTFMTGTRIKKISGRKARRVKNGYWECYKADQGWMSIPKLSHYWLHP